MNSDANLKGAFKEAANSLASFYKNSNELIKESYFVGQKDALNEIVQFTLKESKGDVRNLTVNTLLKFIEDKVYELQEKEAALEKSKAEKQIKKDFQIESNNTSAMPSPLKNIIREDENQQFSMSSGNDLMSAMGLNSQNYQPNLFFQQQGNQNQNNNNGQFFFK
jgi:hypothetical protein